MVDEVNIAEAEHKGVVLQPIWDQLHLIVVEREYPGTVLIVIHTVLETEAQLWARIVAAVVHGPEHR